MPNHNNIPIWEIDIQIIGPVTIQNNINFSTRKELEHPDAFYSDIKIKSNTNGFTATISAFAPNSDLAEKAAILFFGRMLDVLSLRLDLPFQLDLTKNILIQRNSENVRRIVDKEDFTSSFNEARLLSLTETTFLRALSWFRKGQYSQDPFDKFLAYWNSIETVTSKYNPNKLNCQGKGTICHIWECFKTVWGECEKWEFISGQKKWIDECNTIRKNIAHGIIPIEIESVSLILEKLPELEKVAHKFLSDWRINQLNPIITPEIEARLR
ncbi:methylamine utilization protein MauJ [Myroides odoratimimus]|uniref:methylamine utilization protein MauJ n=1 Tax=Myroides odoratimimus TaxID=76832 RepID=UPI0025787D38|nr:methylamine utilization protein MauJ [Myroides odoratimimus]MDM1465393.1 hypothetical protein [Myroides odoratimimus]MDM1475396.1 hypothetical protein [Myroides odoratimimus]